jgi:hypothetical protein
MIDPITALTAISSAVALVKKAAKTVDDVASLGPVLGKYFEAKEQAIEVVKKSQRGEFKGSALGQAIELEMAIEQAREFEEQVKMLFFQANKMDVWQKIVARAHKIEIEAAHAARKQKEAKQRHKKEMEELFVILAASFVIIALVVATGYLILNVIAQGR